MQRVGTYAKSRQYEIVVRGQKDLLRQALTYEFDSVIDIGAGNLAATKAFYDAGKRCAATVNNAKLYGVVEEMRNVTLFDDINIESFSLPEDQKFDAVWFAHVLEHTLNPGVALGRVRDLLKPDGILFLMVPPFKHRVTGGHVSTGWNIGILSYILILTGFDVRNGAFIKHGHNLACFVRKGAYPDVELTHDSGDIERLAHLFHPEFDARQGVNGDVASLGWRWRIEPEYVDEKGPR